MSGNGKGGGEFAYDMDVLMPRSRDLARRLLLLTDLAVLVTLLCSAAWRMWPRPATTRTGVPSASAQGLKIEDERQ